ncbi:MAG: hypothetical protein KUG64_00695 [Cycloclasticus sp.]|nr:hypothetical protein [Cycloclasticus sp.]
MTLAQLQEWLPFLETAPEGIREYLLGTFWILVFLVLVWAILKLLFNKDFKKFYAVIGNTAKATGEISKSFAKGAADNLELPEPYPRLTKLFAVIFMLNNYASFFIFTSFFLVVSILIVTSDISSFVQRMGGMLFSVLLGYFAWFFFAQAERDRIKLFKNKES